MGEEIKGREEKGMREEEGVEETSDGERHERKEGRMKKKCK